MNDDAIATFRRYLNEYDPTWSGPVGSAERQRGKLKKNPDPAGTHRLEARIGLIQAQLAAGQHPALRQNAEDLIALADKEAKADDDLAARVRIKLKESYEQTGPYEKQIEIRREFLQAHPKHPEAPAISRWIAYIFMNNGLPDEAVVAFEEFIGGENYQFIDNAAANVPDPESGITPAAQLERWRQEAAHLIGQIRFDQGAYEKAIARWKKYVQQHPNGAEWAAAQSGIVNASFQLALEAVASDDEDLARERFNEFLATYPLDPRARQILFTLGQMHVVAAEKMEEDAKAKPGAVKARYEQAIAAWARLIGKYPQTEEASLALYRTGILQSEKLDRLEDGLATFKRLQWGSWAAPAQARVTLLSEKSLGVATERTFRSDEKAEVAVTARNIEKVTVSLYPLNLESYFRKTHRLDRIDHLDIGLIQPSKTWEVAFDDYRKYQQLDRRIPIPLPGKGAAAALVKVEGGDWSATTLVLRSDIDLILKSSRREVLVYAEDRRLGKPAAGADLLISDGSKIIATGKTGEDGVFRGRFPELAEQGSVRVFAKSPKGVATNLLEIGTLQSSSGLAARGYIFTDKPAYLPGEEVNIRGILRDVAEGSYQVPEAKNWHVSVHDPAGRLLAFDEVEIDKFGAFDSSLSLPASAALGGYQITAKVAEGTTRWTGAFEVSESKIDRIRLAIEFPESVYFRGEKVSGTIRANYYWGSPAVDQIVEYTLPDGRTLSGKTDAAGELQFEIDTTGFVPGQMLVFNAAIAAHNLNQSEAVFLAELGYGIEVKPSGPVALAGQPIPVTVRTTGADGEPVGRKLTLTILRREVSKSNPTLEAVPWLSHQPPAPR